MVATILTLFWLSWRLSGILLLTFGAIVFAVIFRAIARPLVKRFPQREKLAVLSAVVLLLAALGGVGWLFGHQLTEQLRGLSDRLPEAVASAQRWLESKSWGKLAQEGLSGLQQTTNGAADMKKLVSVTIESIGHVLLMLVTAIYLAVTPRLYLDGVVRLLPVARRTKVRAALMASGEQLKNWLLGQVISMTTIGTLTTLGLWAVGAPLPLALGILAGLLVFVPMVGFLVAFVPTVLIALSESPQVALSATIVFLIVQQLEEQLVQPLAQRWATTLPPALGLIALTAFGVLFGLPGWIFGWPLTVVIMVLVQKLYLAPMEERTKASDRA